MRRAQPETLVSLLTGIALLVCQPVTAAGIAGFGRIQPAGGTVNVSAPSTDTIEKINVKEGQQVAAGEVLAVLSSRAARELQLEEAKLALAQAELDRSSGLRIEEQRHQDLKENHDSAKKRLASLYENKAEGYVSPEYITKREDEIAELEQQLEVSALTLEKLRRSSDFTVTRAQKQVAIAEAALADSTVRSPLSGRILKVLGRPGEHVGPVMFMIGYTSSMFVLAEVYESDALRLKVGQKAVISSAALPAKLNGTVESIGTMIYKSTLNSLDTPAQTSSRVLEALIRLAPDSHAERLINLQVDVVIQN